MAKDTNIAEDYINTDLLGAEKYVGFGADPKGGTYEVDGVTQPRPETPEIAPENVPTQPSEPTQAIPNQTVAGTPESLYGQTREQVQEKKYNLGGQYANAVASFSKGDIVDKMRLKTGGVKDLDQQISALKVDLNKSRPSLLAKYADVIDPTKRESLISQEENAISKNITDLQAIRTYRLGAISDMTQAEIDRGEQKLQGLEAQYNLYNSVLGDMDKADKTKADMEKSAIELENLRLKQMQLQQDMGVEKRSQIEGKTSQEMGPFESNLKQIGTGQITGYGSPKWEWGLDIDGTNGQELRPMLDGQVTFTGDEGKGFGNQVKILDKQGNEIWYSHLQGFNVEKGQTISGNDIIGKIGYTGETIPGKGGDGSHVDITIRKPDGSYMTPHEVEKYIEGGTPGEPKYIKTGLSKTEKAEVKKQEEAKAKQPINPTTVKDLQQNSSKLTTPSKFKENVTTDNANKILIDNVGKWQLGETEINNLFDVATTEAINEYIKQEDIQEFKGLVQAESTENIIANVEDMLDKGDYTKKELKDVLVEAGILDEKGRGIAKGFKENSFLWFDDDALDSLQGILDL